MIDFFSFKFFVNIGGKNNDFENMKLCLDWNKIDIAKNDIFNGNENFTKDELSNLMERYILYRTYMFRSFSNNKNNLINFKALSKETDQVSLNY